MMSETQSGYEIFTSQRDAIEKVNNERAAFAKKAEDELKEK